MHNTLENQKHAQVHPEEGSMVKFKYKKSARNLRKFCGVTENCILPNSNLR
jgi:hypothetical protein